jgi:hypothetical protein
MTEEERAEWEEIRKTVKFEWWMDTTTYLIRVHAEEKRRWYMKHGGLGMNAAGEYVPGTTLPPGTDIADVSEEEMKRRTDKFWKEHLESLEQLHAYYDGTASEPHKPQEPEPRKRWQLLDVILGLWRD